MAAAAAARSARLRALPSWHLGGAAALAALVWQHLVCTVQAQTTLPGHSITAPPNIQQLAHDWFLAGTAIPSLRSTVLNPGVPNRLGLLWSKFPLLTNDFEASFVLSVKGPEKRTAQGHGIAFWYVYENASAAQELISVQRLQNQEDITTNTWATAFAAEGFSLLGYRGQYDGLGVFFCDAAPDKDQPSVSGRLNDGRSQYKLYEGIPTPDAVAASASYRSGSEVHVKIRVQPNEAKVEVVGQGTQQVKGPFRAGGYLGLTVFGGQKGSVEAKERSDVVELLHMTVVNYDKSSLGEDIPRPPPPTIPQAKAAAEKEDKLRETSSYKDHREESEAIKELTNMVFKLVAESQPLRAQMTRAIDALWDRLIAIEKSFEQLKVELDKKTGHNLGAEFDSIKKELTSLSMVASSETQDRHKKLDSLHEDIAHVHKSATSSDSIDRHLDKLTASNQRTLESLTSEHQRMFGVSLAAIAFIVVAGLSLYHKFRCWEKKHIL